MLPTGVLDVLSGLLALEIDSILVNLDNVDVNINDNLIIEGLVISKANWDKYRIIAGITVAMG
jgi:hypothetical protein